jgi:hypothetical protein
MRFGEKAYQLSACELATAAVFLVYPVSAELPEGSPDSRHAVAIEHGFVAH